MTTPSSMRTSNRRSTRRTPTSSRSSSIAPGIGSTVEPVLRIGLEPEHDPQQQERRGGCPRLRRTGGRERDRGADVEPVETAEQLGQPTVPRRGRVEQPVGDGERLVVEAVRRAGRRRRVRRRAATPCRSGSSSGRTPSSSDARCGCPSRSTSAATSAARRPVVGVLVGDDAASTGSGPCWTSASRPAPCRRRGRRRTSRAPRSQKSRLKLRLQRRWPAARDCATTSLLTEPSGDAPLALDTRAYA